MSSDHQVEAQDRVAATTRDSDRAPASPEPALRPLLFNLFGLGGRAVERHVLQLQGAYGNRYVGRILARATQKRPGSPPIDDVEGLAHRSGHPDAAIQREDAATRITVTTGDVQRRTFSVAGANLEEVAGVLDAQGEWGRGGAENIVYNAGNVSSSGVVETISITATLFTRLPVWTGLASRPEPVRNEWNRMLDALRGHENHHVSVAQTALNGLKTSLNGVSETDLPALWQEAMSALQTAQDEYDTSTDHGQNEGVYLDANVETPPEESAGGEEGAESPTGPAEAP